MTYSDDRLWQSYPLPKKVSSQENELKLKISKVLAADCTSIWTITNKATRSAKLNTATFPLQPLECSTRKAKPIYKSRICSIAARARGLRWTLTYKSARLSRKRSGKGSSESERLSCSSDGTYETQQIYIAQDFTGLLKSRSLIINNEPAVAQVIFLRQTANPHSSDAELPNLCADACL